MSSPGAEDRRPVRLAGRRRLAAILHADLAGYVRLMEGAEDRTVSRLKSVRAEVWQPAVGAAGGRIVNIVADSVLAEFGSAVEAVAAAIDIQERMARFNDGLDEAQRLRFRIGLHLGEVIVDETQTIFGDAVNLAARIQLMAEPGGIAASRAIRDATHLQIDRTFVDGGRRHAKNVSRSLQIYHVRPRERASGPLVRAAGQIRRAGVAIWQPVPWASIAVATVLLAGGGYLAFTANQVTSVSTAALNLSADQLEQALAERRKADALTAEKRQLEEQARQRAETEAEAKRRADGELENARQARQKAERELAQLKADIEARRKAEGGRGDQAAVAVQRVAEEAAQRKAEAEATNLRQAEEEAAKRAAADAAAKRQADQALVMATGWRKQAEADALDAASKTAAALPGLKEEAEAEERRLRLEPTDRQRLQVALTSLGFDTRGDDGVFGPRSREMIAHWQRAHRQAATGFMTRAQQQALLKEAAAALSEYDGQRKAEEDARTAPAASVVSPASPPAESADGLWRGTYECGRNGSNLKLFTLRPEVHLKGGAGTWKTAYTSSTNDSTIGISISTDGTDVRVTRQTLSHWAAGGNAAAEPLFGRLEGNAIRASNSACTIVLTRVASSALVAAAPPTAFVSTAYNATYPDAASPTLPSPDGSWRGTYRCNGGLQMALPFVIDLKLHLMNGSATWRSVGPGVINGNSFDVAVSVVRDISRVVRTAAGRQGNLQGNLLGAQGDTLTGQYDGATINATGRESSSGRDCALALTRS
jgi:class 3 adenylate cyclase/peptidoglycan hydrolase-like protein with peptidoglycan-binding domain